MQTGVKKTKGEPLVYKLLLNEIVI